MTLLQLAQFLGGELHGPPDIIITGVNSVCGANSTQVAFIYDKSYIQFAKNCKAAAIVTNQQLNVNLPLIIVKNPQYAFIQTLELFSKPHKFTPQIHPTAIISQTTKLGESVMIGAYVVIEENCRIANKVIIMPNVYIGEDVEIDQDTIIYPNVTIYPNTKIGKRVKIHGGCVIGADGFGYIEVDDGLKKIPQCGNVVIEDDVEIGANTAIDRATVGSTIIKSGTKIDNLVQIGHNTEIGRNCRLAGQVGLSGSVKLGDGVVLAGQVGVADHVTLGENVKVGARSGVTKSWPANKILLGFPAMEHTKFKRALVALQRLPQLLRKSRQDQSFSYEKEKENRK